MKKLIALASAALFAVFAGVEFVLPKYDEFSFNSQDAPGNYFEISTTSSGEDYRSLYGAVHGFASSEVEMCNLVPYQASRETWRTLVDAGVTGFDKDVWEPVPEGVADVEYPIDGMVQYTLKEGCGDVEIAAPLAGEIKTSHYACDYGQSMEFSAVLSNGATYTMTISGAKCWYCCSHKEVPADGRYTATSTNSLQGQVMRVGDVLCIGKPGTVISLYCSVNSTG